MNLLVTVGQKNGSRNKSFVLYLCLVNKHVHTRNDDRGYFHQYVKHVVCNASKNVVWSHIRPEIGHSITLACSVIRIHKIQ